MKNIGYVYLTKNLINGKLYVGQHLSIEFDKHYKGSGIAITHAINKYGWNNFSCEIICWCNNQTQLNEAEDNYIKLLGTMYPNGYNLKGGGSRGRLSKETRQKISDANIGLKHNLSIEGKKVLIDKQKGKKLSEETKEKISIAKRNPSEETRRKISESHKGRIPWNKGIKCKNISETKKGKKLSEEHCKKISEAQKKRFKKPEERKKLSECCKGRKLSEETRRKMSESAKRRLQSPEARKKRSEAAKKGWQNKKFGIEYGYQL